MLSLYDQQEEKDFFLLFLYIIGQSDHCRTLKKKKTHTQIQQTKAFRLEVMSKTIFILK